MEIEVEVADVKRMLVAGSTVGSEGIFRCANGVMSFDVLDPAESACYYGECEYSGDECSFAVDINIMLGAVKVCGDSARIEVDEKVVVRGDKVTKKIDRIEEEYVKSF